MRGLSAHCRRRLECSGKTFEKAKKRSTWSNYRKGARPSEVKRRAKPKLEPLGAQLDLWKTLEHSTIKGLCESMGPKAKQHSNTRDSTPFRQVFGRMGSEGILQCLAEKGRDAAWFAEEFAKEYERSNQFSKRKLLEMLTKIIQQHEGQKLHVDDVGELSTEEMEENYKEIMVEIRRAISDGNGTQPGPAAKGRRRLPAPAGAETKRERSSRAVRPPAESGGVA